MGDKITRRDHKLTHARPTTQPHVFQLQPFHALILEVADVHFHCNSSVLLPNYPPEDRPLDGPSLDLAALAKCLKHQRDNPSHSVLIVGHADTSGDPQDNLNLSQQRALAVWHAVRGERDQWVSICRWRPKVEDYQLILTWITDAYGWHCDPKGVDNILGSHTEAAIKSFQTKYNKEPAIKNFDRTSHKNVKASIRVDGVVGEQTWGAFFDVYMDVLKHLCETDDEGLASLSSKLNFYGLKVVGCGDNWPLEDPPIIDYESQADRRVEILFFESGQEPKLDCHQGGQCKPVLCELYNRKMYKFNKVPVSPRVPEPVEVFLKLTYLAPDDAKTECVFPPGFPVSVVWGDNSVHAEKVQKTGLLNFKVPRSQGSFTLKFDTSDIYVSAGPQGTAGQEKTAHASDLADLHKQGARFFKVPQTWTLRQSDWTAVSAPHYDAANFVFDLPGSLAEATLGSSASPESLRLDPHWSYLRFEFFDRYFGHSDHNHKRINIPATLIDGWRSSPPGANPDTRSHWTIRDNQNEKAVHAIPWILQFQEDRTADSKPDKNIQLGFQADANTYVISNSATSRKVDAVTDAEKRKPSADRLKLYDLPKQWKSQNYYTRFSDGSGEFFDKAATFEGKITASTSADKPLIFSLDDIVLTDDAKHQVTLTADDHVAIVYHKFIHADEAGQTSLVGVYNPDVGATASYQTKLDMAGKYYISDYPNWVRLVITQQNLWDCFSQRTEDGGPNQVIGARAAVRWADATAYAPQIATIAQGKLSPANMVAGALADTDFFSVQPYFEQRYNQTNLKYTGIGSTQQGIGRYDMALLRCCDHEGDKEVFFVFQYLRLLFNFSAAPANAASPQAYMDNLCANVAARWNGNETDMSNKLRGQLLPQDNNKQIKGYVVWFLQPVPDTLANANTRAHFLINVTAAGGRAFMTSANGYGEFGNNCDAPEGTYAVGSYTGAHEVGHGNSLPDEYCERWNACSWGELSFWCRLPGDPYDADGRFDPGANPTLTQQDSGMMNGVVMIRNRYFWHAAEFARLVTRVSYKVKYDTYDDYKIPPHKMGPIQQYTGWPISDAVDSAQGARGKFDLLAYAMGKDRYTCDILPHATHASPFDGVLVVMVKMQITVGPTMTAGSAATLLPVLRSTVSAGLNDKFMATGKVHSGSDQEWQFSKCQIRFSPRFAVTNPDPTDTDYATNFATVHGIGEHFFIDIDHNTAPNSRWTLPNRLKLEVDRNNPAWDTALGDQFRDYFAEMIGFADEASITKAALKPMVQRVITTNGDVADIV